MNNEHQDAKEQAKQAIYAAIAEQAAGLKSSRGQTGAAEALKNLAEAYAWVSNTAQPH
ncbi:hypothetical protein [Streptomyces rhizosphaericus]|uniref:Uncharacterized protein n=1 Tax=Streptomyces rhizosphaericus TaxID=114699 RepID=A0A6G4AQW9_9ACTN|nr:hypothetical protein [Streptomyces rhizosphaericus]NEW74981.1 hypothetical protein [Streptomyces rhizosphaericus]